VLDWAYHTAGVQYAYTVRLRDTGTVRLTSCCHFRHPVLCFMFLCHVVVVVCLGSSRSLIIRLISHRLIAYYIHFHIYFSTSLSITFTISSAAFYSLILSSRQHLVHFTRLEIRTDILLSYSTDSRSRPPRSALRVPRRQRWSRTSRGS
jgi:hypothetical protein